MKSKWDKNKFNKIGVLGLFLNTNYNKNKPKQSKFHFYLLLGYAR